MCKAGPTDPNTVPPSAFGLTTHCRVSSFPLPPEWPTSSTESAKKRQNPLTHLFIRENLQTLLLDHLVSKQWKALVPKVGGALAADQHDLTTAIGHRSSQTTRRDQELELCTLASVIDGIRSEFAPLTGDWGFNVYADSWLFSH